MPNSIKRANAVRDKLETRETRPVVRAIPSAAIHGGLWVLFLGMMLWYVPFFARIFKEFDASLPVITIWVLQLSSLSARYWPLVAPCIALLCVVDLLVLSALYLRPGLTIIRWAWLALMPLVPLGLVGLTVLVTVGPLLSLFQSLS